MYIWSRDYQEEQCLRLWARCGAKNWRLETVFLHISSSRYQSFYVRLSWVELNLFDFRVQTQIEEIEEKIKKCEARLDDIDRGLRLWKISKEERWVLKLVPYSLVPHSNDRFCPAKCPAKWHNISLRQILKITPTVTLSFFLLRLGAALFSTGQTTGNSCRLRGGGVRVRVKVRGRFRGDRDIRQCMGTCNNCEKS